LCSLPSRRGTAAAAGSTRAHGRHWHSLAAASTELRHRARTCLLPRATQQPDSSHPRPRQLSCPHRWLHPASRRCTPKHSTLFRCLPPFLVVSLVDSSVSSLPAQCSPEFPFASSTSTTFPCTPSRPSMPSAPYPLTPTS